MKAVIQLDVPEWQIGQDVSVYFPDTMLKHGKCELLKEQEEEIQSLRRENHDILTQFHKWAKEQQQIVRCKDCIWFEMPRFGERGFCKHLDIVRETTFYCADGERKSD